LEPHIEGLSHIIGDTNVIRFDSTLIRFVAKDSGSTVIMFSYGDFADTLGVYISFPVIDHAITMCDLDTVSLDAGISDPSKNYQWQVDTSGIFVNVVNNAFANGATTPVLELTGIPTSWTQAKLKC